MKKRTTQLSKVQPSFFRLQWFWLVALLLIAGVVSAQEEAEDSGKDLRPVRNTFNSTWLIDNQTVMIPVKGTLQFDINHRFGTLNNGYSDFFGLYASSNIRLGFDFVPIERLMIGFGFTKERNYWDFNARYAILRQARKGGSPISLTYLVNMGMDTRKKSSIAPDPETKFETIDRLSFFHQLMIARKFSNAFSLQASLSLSHFNFQEQVQIDPDNQPGVTTALKNDHLAIAFLGRLAVSPTTSIIANVDIPLTDHGLPSTLNDAYKPAGNISFGIEFTSSSHAFQIFVGNYKSIVPQLNNMYNQNEWTDGVLIGFNITRLWNF